MDLIIAAVMPHILEIISIVLASILAWVANVARRKWGIDVEARHRDALHSALLTGARLALERKLDLKAAIGLILGHAQASVPDAIAALKPSARVLEDLAQSKLREAAQVVGDDRLAEALRSVLKP